MDELFALAGPNAPVFTYAFIGASVLLSAFISSEGILPYYQYASELELEHFRGQSKKFAFFVISCMSIIVILTTLFPSDRIQLVSSSLEAAFAYYIAKQPGARMRVMLLFHLIHIQQNHLPFIMIMFHMIGLGSIRALMDEVKGMIAEKIKPFPHTEFGATKIKQYMGNTTSSGSGASGQQVATPQAPAYMKTAQKYSPDQQAIYIQRKILEMNKRVAFMNQKAELKSREAGENYRAKRIEQAKSALRMNKRIVQESNNLTNKIELLERVELQLSASISNSQVLDVINSSKSHITSVVNEKQMSEAEKTLDSLEDSNQRLQEFNDSVARMNQAGLPVDVAQEDEADLLKELEMLSNQQVAQQSGPAPGFQQPMGYQQPQYQQQRIPQVPTNPIQPIQPVQSTQQQEDEELNKLMAEAGV
ncbi:MAG: hypothetical protein EZS28_017498 [Streblomastix strix]|uniref:Derlin n=1 Tax=Streblomastix strix TaxID=222440 RepID=A0A5J4VXR4_9EUKA|nr:MAG: hypothetical protein EZS28_017498 [Streblomastix strix]